MEKVPAPKQQVSAAKSGLPRAAGQARAMMDSEARRDSTGSFPKWIWALGSWVCLTSLHSC